MANFINFTNHPSTRWDKKQLVAAETYGTVVDFPFPAVPSDATEHGIDSLSNAYCERIMNMDPVAVLCQGEFTLAYAVITKLKANGVTVLAACSERNSVENEDGTKTVRFEFVQFRRF